MRKVLAAVLLSILAMVGLELIEDPDPNTDAGEVHAMDGPEDPPTPRP